MDVDKDTFQDWLDLAITQKFMAWVQAGGDDAADAWEQALWGQQSAESLQFKRAALQERRLMVAEVTQVSYEDLYGEQERNNSD